MSVSAVKLQAPNCFSYMLHTTHRIVMILLHVLPVVLSNFSSASVVYNMCGGPLELYLLGLVNMLRTLKRFKRTHFSKHYSFHHNKDPTSLQLVGIDKFTPH